MFAKKQKRVHHEVTSVTNIPRFWFTLSPAFFTRTLRRQKHMVNNPLRFFGLNLERHFWSNPPKKNKRITPKNVSNNILKSMSKYLMHCNFPRFAKMWIRFSPLPLIHCRAISGTSGLSRRLLSLSAAIMSSAAVLNTTNSSLERSKSYSY